MSIWGVLWIIAVVGIVGVPVLVGYLEWRKQSRLNQRWAKAERERQGRGVSVRQGFVYGQTG